MSRGRWVVLSFLLVVLASWAHSDPSSEIATLYADAAFDALRTGEADRAVRLSEIAREFSSSSSDVLYVSALAVLRSADDVTGALGFVVAARQLDEWSRFSAVHGDVLVARLFNRIGRHADAAGVLSVTPRRPQTPAELLGEYYVEYVTALRAGDRLAEADAVLEDARDRFPDDPRLAWFQLVAEPFPSTEYRREIDRLLAIGPATQTDQPPLDASSGLLHRGPGLDELVFAYGMRVASAAEQAWATDTLARRGWMDARRSELVALRDGSVAVDLFLQHDGYGDLGLLRRLAAAVDEAERLRLMDGAAVYTGVSVLDPEYDGIWNEVLDVVDGRIVRWRRDSDQDRVVDADIMFGPEAPSSVVVRSDGEVARLEYAQYPYLAAGEMETAAGIERYILRPRSARLDLIEPLPADGPLFGPGIRLAENTRPVSRAELRSTAVRIDVLDATRRVVERAFQSRGVLRQVLRDENTDGAWDHLLLHDGGFAIAGVRDLDSDGYFEVAEGYRNGSLVALAVDADDDGVPELFEREPGVPVREWDTNGDGAIDVREFEFWTDSVIREFPLAEQPR